MSGVLKLPRVRVSPAVFIHRGANACPTMYPVAAYGVREQNSRTARINADFSDTSGSVSFALEETPQQITVTIIADEIDEWDESFVFYLGWGNAGYGAQATITIEDTDAEPTISIEPVGVTEADFDEDGNPEVTDATFTVTLSLLSEKDASVNYEIRPEPIAGPLTPDDTGPAPATAGSDFTASPTSGTLAFAPDSKTRTITVSILGDVIDEYDELFRVELSGPSNATIADGIGVGTIVDNDAPPDLTIDDVIVKETMGVAQFTAELSHPTEKVHGGLFQTYDVTAVWPHDYTQTSQFYGTFTPIFPPGVTSRTIDVPIIADSMDEGSETFRLMFFQTGANLNEADVDAKATNNQKSNAELDLAKLCGTETWESGVTVRIELTYEFEQSPNITTGQFVDTDLANRWQASFFHNSGVKIENRTEIQIFDTASLLNAIAGSNETLDGNVVTMTGDVAEINAQHYVKLHYGDPAHYSTVTDADHVSSLISGIPYHWDGLANGTYADLVSAPQGGQTMVILVTKDDNGEYDFTITIGAGTAITYHVPGSGTADAGMLYLQSHWGSGVIFRSAKVEKLP